MTENQVQTENLKNPLEGGMVHFILSHSYVVFFMAVILGAIFHIIFNIRIFSATIYPYLGFVMIIVGTILIYWAQSSSARVKKQVGDKRSEKNFECGPYKYSRNPTHIGMTIMTVGLALILNSLFMFIFVVIASLITKFIFLKAEEKILQEKYGQPYIDYKKKVSTWV